jgi:CRISPR-associated protein Csm1
MSVQIFLQGKLLGIDEFLTAPAAAGQERTFAGRSHWINLLSEVLPRALLAELGLAKILLGTSGGDQFLLVLPSESRPAAEEFLTSAAREIRELSGDFVNLTWAMTENLGDWTIVRKRLNDEMRRKRGTPAAGVEAPFFEAFAETARLDDAYFADEVAARLRDAREIGWSPAHPGKVTMGAEKHTWPIDGSAEAIAIARHTAPGEDEARSATAAELAVRANGRAIWGVLRGDVDNFAVRLRRLETIEEHLQLSMMYKQFFAGELNILCSMPDFWRKVNILYAGGDDFAVYGAWDALLPLAREIQRLFHRYAEEYLRELPGPEGKTVTMALALAPDPGATLASVFEEAGHKLEIAKSTDKDCVYALGRILEWKQLADATELKDGLMRLIAEFGSSPEYIDELCGIYRETAVTTTRKGRATERPWRFHRRLNRILPAARDREFQKARNSVITELVGKNPAHVKLRPSGRVALEWARLSTESEKALT